MHKVTDNNGILNWSEQGRAFQAPYSEVALNVLGRRGFDLKPLLGLNGRLKNRLYNYQYTAVHAARLKGYNLLIADEMGVGKTASAIACMVDMQSQKTLIVTPSNVKLQWERELNSWITKCPKVFICEGRNWKNHHAFQMNACKIVIINYEILDAWLELLKHFTWDLLICDESHRLKNSDAGCTRAALHIRDNVKSAIMLSGTPLTDRTADLFNSIYMVDPTLFPSELAYQQRFCNGFIDEFGRASASSNTIELNHILTSTGTMIRRTKKDVYKQLPVVTTTIVPIKASSSVLRESEEQLKKDQTAAEYAYGQERSRLRIKIENSKEEFAKEAIRLKLPHTIKLIEEFLENTDEKLVVACIHRELCSEVLAAHFGSKGLMINGAVSAKNKDAIVQKFIHDKTQRLLIGNIQSIYAGIDGLQKVCSHMILCEFPWSPADLWQLFARLDRNGQANHVNLYLHVIYGSMDEDRAKLIDKKSDIVSEVLDGKSIDKSKKLTTLIKQEKRGTR